MWTDRGRGDRQLWSNSDRAATGHSSAFLRDAVVHGLVQLLTNSEYVDRNSRYASNAEVYELSLRGRDITGSNGRLRGSTGRSRHSLEQSADRSLRRHTPLADAYTLMGYFALSDPVRGGSTLEGEAESRFSRPAHKRFAG